MNKYHILDKKTQVLLKKLKGPIVIFGAGGFVGINLLNSILQYRKDVYGISQDSKKNWRFIASKLPNKNLRDCDINEPTQVKELIKEIKPKTIFNLAAYGAYSKQKEYSKIYRTNINSTFTLIETLKEYGFDAYIHAGSQSEYGTNSRQPKENAELIPNSHYAVSKITNYFTVKYYGRVEKLPVVHLRLYSVYGPWEEPDRLIPVLLSKARNGELPPFVQPTISRDFVYINDIVRSFIYAAAKMNKSLYGEVFNVATGKKTSIKQLALLTKLLLKVSVKPVFGSMENRDWDLEDWYGNIKKIKKTFNWYPTVTLRDGLLKTAEWQEEINFDSAFWNPNKSL